LNAAKRGIGVILTYNSQRGQAMADEINHNGGKAVALQLESADTGSLSNFGSQVLQVLRTKAGTYWVMDLVGKN